MKEDEDPRRMYRLIDFIRTLINIKTMPNTFAEISRWFLFRNLYQFEWRIPSIWLEINEHANVLLDHPSSAIRERISL